MTFIKGLKRAETPEETFERLSIPIPECGCYAWLGSHNDKDYPKITYNDKSGKRRMMQRVTTFLCSPPDNMEVDHLCHQRWCVNKDHMEVVTHAENIRRHAEWVKKNRLSCEKHGLPLKYYGKLRVCRECKNEYQRKRRDEEKARLGTRRRDEPYKFVCSSCGSAYETYHVKRNGKPVRGCKQCLRTYKAKWKREKIRRTNQQQMELKLWR